MRLNKAMGRIRQGGNKAKLKLKPSNIKLCASIFLPFDLDSLTFLAVKKLFR